MGFLFVYSNNFSIGIQQLMAILSQAGVPTELILSKYSHMELSYLEYITTRENNENREKAIRLLEEEENCMISQITAMKPEVVGFSVTTDNFRHYLKLAKKIKLTLPRTSVVMGGPHPTFLPEQVMSFDFIDAVYIGEADSDIVDLYETLRNKKEINNVPGAWIRYGDQLIKSGQSPLVADLDELPFPEIDSFAKNNPELTEFYPLLTARGCPFNCSYCNSASYKKMYKGFGKYVRKRSAENCLEELEIVTKKYDIKQIHIIDDVFTMDFDWLEEFLPAYKERINLPYTCLVHPERIEARTISLLKETGCIYIKCGIQSINPQISRKVFKRRVNLEKIRSLIKEIKNVDIVLKLDFIIGAPGETEEDLINLVDFIKEVKVDDIFLYFLKYYPKTQIIDYALDNDYITAEKVQSIVEGSDYSYQFVPEYYEGKTRALYEKYNVLIREAAGSEPFNEDRFAYLLK